MADIPEGFEPLFRTSPFLDLIGPIYSRREGSGFVLALRAERKHCNARDLVHGGVIGSVADVALGYNAVFAASESVPMVTANLSIDYAGSAKLGDWIEARVDVQKVGKRMAFANCYFSVGEQRIARASGIFGVVDARR